MHSLHYRTCEWAEFATIESRADGYPAWPQLKCLLQSCPYLLLVLYLDMAILSKPARWPPQRISVLVFATILILRSRILDIPKESLARLLATTKKTPLTPEALLLTLQQVYTKEKDGSKTLLVPYNDQVAKVCL